MLIQLRREKLHNQIWGRPIGYLARDLGVTTATLREACRVMAIPVPAVGYWAATRSGRSDTPPALPEHDGPTSVTVNGQPRETLVDWVNRETPTQPATQLMKRRGVALDAGTAPPQLVPLKVWANLLLGAHAPHYNTLLRWAHEGRIQPQPKKIGRRWFVSPNADYVGD